jgi:hypothetical protein
MEKTFSVLSVPGPIVAAVPSGLRLTPPQGNKKKIKVKEPLLLRGIESFKPIS